MVLGLSGGGGIKKPLSTSSAEAFFECRQQSKESSNLSTLEVAPSSGLTGRVAKVSQGQFPPPFLISERQMNF